MKPSCPSRIRRCQHPFHTRPKKEFIERTHELKRFFFKTQVNAGRYSCRPQRRNSFDVRWHSNDHSRNVQRAQCARFGHCGSGHNEGRVQVDHIANNQDASGSSYFQVSVRVICLIFKILPRSIQIEVI